LQKVHPEMRRRIKRSKGVWEKKLWREDLERWDKEWLPAIQRRHAALEQVNPRDLGNDELLSHLNDCRATVEDNIFWHHRMNGTVIAPLGDYLAQGMQLTGLSASQLLQLLEGTSPATVGAAGELERLGEAI